jgi:hypothetical protein
MNKRKSQVFASICINVGCIQLNQTVTRESHRDASKSMKAINLGKQVVNFKGKHHNP